MRLFRRRPLVIRSLGLQPHERLVVECVTKLESELGPGDRIVVESPHRVSDVDGADIASALAHFFDIEPERILVICNATLRVVREGEPPPPPIVLAPRRV